MSFIPFELERWQSAWEHRVSFNLSESGVHPLSIAELLHITDTDPDELAAIRLGYSQADGTDQLRAAIAALYPGSNADNVIVTVGSSEANFVTSWTLLEPGDKVAILSPLYRQTWGLAQNFGAEVSTFELKPELGWEPDPDEVARAIQPGTKLVVITNPNNPTGHVLSPSARTEIVARTEAVGAWLLADEVYLGAELDGQTTETFWGNYERTVAVNGLSKAYALPGLRIGWLVAPAEFKEALWSRHDYTVIGPASCSDFLATRALGARDEILARTRKILNENYPVLDRWLQQYGPAVRWWRPDCGAISFVQYKQALASLDLAERIRQEYDVLIEPGEHFGFERSIRFGYGNETAEFKRALDVLTPAFQKYLMD
ncbi:MAG: aminotransferase class I/II-fold pyridoxal phosphate-dependent enzyme [Gemmatimonadota bacterium]|nr:MAG: aminotransferase class I/II-fold pyridoxal phosphate-dependent enzyme [Gemmatimonadota bacterium]